MLKIDVQVDRRMEKAAPDRAGRLGARRWVERGRRTAVADTKAVPCAEGALAELRSREGRGA